MEDNRGLADLIRSHRPPSARAYYLQNSNGRFPVSGGYSLEPFKPPGCPGGSYSLCFLSDASSNQTLSPAIPNFGYPIIPVPASDGSVESAALAKKEAAAVGTPPKQPDPLLTNPDHIRNRVEYEQIRMADETVRSKLFLTDLGQSLAYVQFWRRESQAAMTSQQEIAQRERERAERDRQQAEAEVQRLSKQLREERMERPAAAPDNFATSLAFLGQLAGLAGTALSPAIAKQQAGKSDPVVDALIGASGEGERTSTESAALQTTKRELETARTELAVKKAAAAAAAEKKAAKPESGATEKKSAPDIVERALTAMEKMERRLRTLEKKAKPAPQKPKTKKKTPAKAAKPAPQKPKTSKKKTPAKAAKPANTRNSKEVKKKSTKGAKR